MQTYTLHVAGVTRQLPVIGISDDTAIASFVIISDTELIQAAAKQLVEKIQENGPIEQLLTAEAKGIALAYEVSRLLGLKQFVVARKSVKSYMQNVVSHEVKSITTDKPQMLYLDGNDARLIKGKRICLIDDVISTGESLQAIEDLAIKAGAQPVCRAAVLAEGDAANRKDILFLEKLPLFKKDDNGVFQPIG
ncbi:MAG: phosphoribosyltransferase family protein [Lactimicrobium massiliense]|nr:phosphoribosyltransferase family protein [Lactimicrobium massiliense]MDD6726856.1 phosphoribosyltransferase family protein [Lactimicrobium massiliense]